MAIQLDRPSRAPGDSRKHGETDLMLDDYVNKLDADTRAAGEKAAKPWIDAIKPPKS